MRLIQTEENRRCPACGDECSELFCEGRDRLYRTTEQTFSYHRCLNCKTIFQAKRPVESEIWQCYPESYGPFASKVRQQTLIPVPMFASRAAQKLADRVVGFGVFQKWIRGVEQCLIQAGEILDFGCGSGKYLDRARKLGCKTIGTDFSPLALEETSRKGHETLLANEPMWNTISARRLKFVRMNHVVEHLYDPLLTLRKIHAAMDKGGFLHLSTPNPLGPSASLYGGAWWGLECPRHISLIPPVQLEKMLKQVGFGTVEITQEPVSKDLLRSWAYERVDAGWLKNVDIEGLAADGVLNLMFSFHMARHMRNHRHADRYHILAVK